MWTIIIVAWAKRISSRVPASGAPEKTKYSTTGESASSIEPATAIAENTAPSTSR